MLYFAYDGSAGGDWVSHYAVRLAARREGRQLRLVHVRERRSTCGPDSPTWADRVAAIQARCEADGVALHIDVRPAAAATTDVAASLAEVVPPGRDSFLVCGTRSRPRGANLLAGTMAEKLLRTAPFHVLALRVVQPGLLGQPHDFLLPVAGHPRGFRGGLPFLAHFAPDVLRLHLLFVQRIGRHALRRLSAEAAEPLLRRGRDYVHRVERELVDQLDLAAAHCDARVTVADDVAREIVNYANRVHAQLIYLGASQRSLTQRLLGGNPLEQVLAAAPCDVAIYGGAVQRASDMVPSPERDAVDRGSR